MVLDLTTGNSWQYFDKDGLLMPWYTRGALDVLETLDLKNMNVWEWGLGASTCYYARNAKKVYGVDDNKDWFLNVEETLLHNRISHKSYLSFEKDENDYVNAIKKGSIDFGIIIIDGQYREQCFFTALDYAKKGTVLIFDNFMQPSCEVQSEEMQETVKLYQHEIFKEPTHQDWQTLILYK